MKDTVDLTLIYYLQDSAAWYESEREVALVILDFCKTTGIARDDIFHKTKLKLNDGYDSVQNAIQRSFGVCRLGYIDLYLIHGPLDGLAARKERRGAIFYFQEESEGLLPSIALVLSVCGTWAYPECPCPWSTRCVIVRLY